jgi:tetratricopeptide (TPR) repeat protein
MLSFHGYMSPVECWAGAIPSAQKALKYGPELAETHNTLAVIALLHDRNLKNAEREFVRALEINPSTIQARVWYGLFYFTQILGNFEKGIEQLKIAIEKDPLSSYAHSCLGIGLATGNKLEESIEIGKFAVKLDPNSMIARFNLCYGYLWSGQLDQALEQGLIAVESSNRHAWTLHQILLIYLKIDQRDKALKIYDELEEKYKNHSLPPSSMAISAAAIGKDKYALELALKAVDIYDPFLPYNAFKLKNAEALRNIPGFDGVIKRLGYFDKN